MLERSPTTFGVPVGYLVAALDAVERHGHPTERILERFGIERSQLADAGNRIHRDQYYVIIDHILIELQIPGFGLHMGRAERMSDHGILGTAILASNDLRSALELASSHQLFLEPAAPFFVDLEGSAPSIVCLGSPVPHRFRWSVEAVLAPCTTIVRQCIGEAAQFSSLMLSYADPGYAGLYEEIFRCPVRFEQTRNELCVPPELLDQPLLGTNAALRDMCVTECDKALASLSPGRHLVESVEGILLTSAGSIPKQSHVARRLHMSGRTLQRRLDALGTSYRTIVEEHRRRLGERYLAETNLEPKEIAFLLGYSEPANFHHAFRRWAGCTPREYRLARGERKPVARSARTGRGAVS
jgi:AraC-like DNA-binding protein